MIKKIFKIMLVFIIVLIASEALLRLFPLPDPFILARNSETRRVHKFLPSWNAFSGWFGKTPPFSITFHTGPLIGVSTTQTTFTVNRYGFPYDEAKSKRKKGEGLRIGVVGGSTVECAALEQRRRWPDVLETLLSQEMNPRGVTVLNMGVSDQGTSTHMATVAQLAVKLDLDYLVFMLGANDLPRADNPADLLFLDDAFIVQDCHCMRNFLMNFQLLRRLRVIYHRFRRTEYYVSTEGEDRPYFAAKSREMLGLTILPSAKINISPQVLDDYEENIVSLSALAVAHGITPIFTTQPMLWKPVMDPSEEAVDWLSKTVTSEGHRYRVPSSEQARALETINQRLLEACSRRRFKCIDLEKMIPRSLEFFYDSVHLNEAGAESVGRYVADFIFSDLITNHRISID